MSATGNASVGVLVAGHLLAVPVTLYTPGFLRLWRRREPLLLAAALVGSSLVTAGWAMRSSVGATTFNGAWTLGFSAAYLAEGRKRRRAARAGHP